MNAHRWMLAIFCLSCVASSTLPLAVRAADEEGIRFFEQKIRPVLVEQCQSCHSVAARDAKKLQAALYLDSAAGIAAGGESGAVIVAGKPAESRLIKALKWDGLEMPPSSKLSPETIANFEKWIEMGAPDPRVGSAPVTPKREINIEEGKKWWSFQPLRAIAPPDPQKPIDSLVHAAQQSQGLQPNPPASKEKLIRRAYFDLIGLPPTPEQIEAFVADSSPQAFERVVDSLLASPAYGERWARHWLDVARFAESGGYEFDGFRGGAFHYRDWVIRALNEDMPYDQFVREQLAADKLRPEDYRAAAATGFLVAGPYPGQITAKTIERIRYDQLDDMLMTIGGSMLGLTLGCVRCHDHKYDPIQQRDYYALAADLGRTSHGSRFMDPDPAATAARIAQHDADHEKLIATANTFAMTELPAKFDAWKSAELPKQPDAPRWQILEPVSFEAERSWLKQAPGGIVAFDAGINPGTILTRRGEKRAVRNEDVERLTFRTHQRNIQALRFDALTDKSLPSRGPGLNGDGSFQLIELKVTARPITPADNQPPVEVKLKPVFAAFADPNQPIEHAVDGQPNTAWVVQATARKDNAAVFELTAPLAGFPSGTELEFEFRFRDAGLGRIRCSISTEANPATWAGDLAPQHASEIRAILAAHGNALPESLRPEMLRWFAPFDEAVGKLARERQAHRAARPRPPIHEVYTTIDGGQDVFLLRRGEVDNKQGKAEPGVIQVLFRGAQPAPAGTPPAPAAPASPAPSEPRLILANWITDLEHGSGGLLARVMANRVWQHHFGKGIVATPNDFGAQGARPSHPDLLEYLANELVRGGWKLKPLHRQIMLSAAYQQSHEVRAENDKIDPTNIYLTRYPSRRLEAETIRDALLAVGGNLDATPFGQSVLEDSTRRSIYLRVKRSELLPVLTIFDAPEPTQSIGERTVTTVPTQALAMLNSPFVRRQAERLMARIKQANPTTPAMAVDRGYQIGLGRAPTDAERARMVAFIDQQRAALEPAPDAADRALVEFCHTLLCLSEFVYVD